MILVIRANLNVSVCDDQQRHLQVEGRLERNQDGVSALIGIDWTVSDLLPGYTGCKSGEAFVVSGASVLVCMSKKHLVQSSGAYRLVTKELVECYEAGSYSARRQSVLEDDIAAGVVL